MKSKEKRLINILMIGFIISLINMNINDFQKQKLGYDKNIEETILYELKSSENWVLIDTTIIIDDTQVGTYDWATINATYDWCIGSGTKEDPYIIENIIIDGLNTDNCIEIWHSSVYFIIRNCTLYNSNDSGMYLNDVFNAKIHNNTCHSNVEGIRFQNDGGDNKITNNIVRDNIRTGIFLESFNDFCIIHNNTAINNNQHGIVLGQESTNIYVSNNFVKNNIYGGILIQGDSINNTIIENTIVRNNNNGIWIFSDSKENIIKRNNISSNIGYGIKIHYSDNNTVIENTIFNNTIYGIEFCSYITIPVTYNIIVNNTIISNTIAGIHLDDYSMNNSIFLNNFINNNINGYDTGINNTNVWDTGTVGNYWDDYSGADDDDDGIGDTQKSGGVAPSFIIEIEAGVPDYMWYTLGTSPTKYFFVFNNSINQAAWDAISSDTIKLTFYINDSMGLIASDEVVVRIDIASLTVSGFNVLIVFITIIVSLVGVSWKIRKKR
jgi:parallel beta-helix repeat protein